MSNIWSASSQVLWRIICHAALKQKILEDYEKSKPEHPHYDAGEAAEYGTDAGFKAVQESRDAMAGLQDKQTELLEAQKDLQGQAVTYLQKIAGKTGDGENVVSSFF